MHVFRKLSNFGYVLPVVASLYSGCGISCDRDAGEGRNDTRFVVRTERKDGSTVLPGGYEHKQQIQEPRGHIIASCTPEDVARSAERLKRIEENYRYYPDGGLEERTQDK